MMGSRMVRRATQTLKKYLQPVGYVRWSRMSVAIVFVLSLFVPTFIQISEIKAYSLTPEVKKVLGSANKNLSAKFSLDKERNIWQFNKNGVAALASNIAKQDKGQNAEDIAGGLSQLAAQQAGGSGKNDTSLYSVDLPLKSKEGITYYDNVTRLSFKMVPTFNTRDAKLVDDRIVYPFGGGGKIVYTAKTNGLKEDIVLSDYIGDTLRYSYTLDLPETLEARILDDGSIGIYSANPALFGNISFNTDEDRARVMEGRKNGHKENLVFGIPAPYIKDQNGKAGKTHYELDGKKLSVVASGLEDLSYPLAVDPSVTVTSSADFEAGNLEDAIEINSSGQIDRTRVTGATIGAFTAASTMNTQRALMDSAIYNGYIYAVGSWTNQGTTIEYAKIQSNGSLGAWTQQATGLSNRYGFGVATYNGYLYLTGGMESTPLNTTSYAKLNADGSVGTMMTASTTFNTGRYFHKTKIYNGYIYVIGGRGDASGFDIDNYSSTRYAKLKANGDIDTWVSATTLPTPRLHFGMAIYNDRMYLVGGFYYDNSPVGAADQVFTNNIISADINSDGSLGAWSTNVATVDGLNGGRAEIYGGYMYVLRTSDIQYAPIYLNGRVGTFQTTTAPPDYGSHAALAVYNGYLYKYGGGTGGTDLNTAYYAAINPAGSLGTLGTETNYEPTTGRLSFATVTYNNILYVLGGSVGNSGGRVDMKNTARYAPINSDGTVGTWNTTTTGFNQVNSGTGSQTCTSVAVCPGRVNLAAGAYNGYMYIAGGISNGGSNDHWSDVQSARICTGAGSPLVDCAGAGDLRGWTTIFTDYLTNSTTTYTEANGRSKVGMQIFNGKMYLLGGQNDSTNFYSHIYVSTLTDTGGAGNFALSGISLPSARANVSTFMHGNKLYIVGGSSTGTSWAHSGNDACDVQFISIDPSTGSLTGSWTDANTMSGGSGSSFAAANGRNSYGVSYINGVLYISGGYVGGSAAGLTTTMRATINTNGSFGSWTATSSFTTARAGLKSVAVKGNLYIVGGCPQLSVVFGSYCNSVGAILETYQAVGINNGGNGDIQGWTPGGSGTFTTARTAFGSFAYNGFMYVLGGNTSGGLVSGANTQLFAPISNTGVVGAWTSIPNPPTMYGNEAWVFSDGYIYKMGGRHSEAGSHVETWYAAVCTGTNTTTVFSTNCTTGSTPGTLSSWNAGASMNTGRDEFGAVAHNGYLYVFGGCTSSGARIDWICTTESNTVEVSQINTTTRAPGAWSALSSGNNFTTPRFRHQTVAQNGYVYLIGGCANIPSLSSTCDTDLIDVQMAKLNGAGLAADAGCGVVWCKQDTAIDARMEFGAVAYNGYLYTAGGAEGPFSDVRFAPILPNGGLGKWAKAHTDFSTVRRGLGTVAYGGNLYVLGGTNTAGNVHYNDVQFAPLKTIPRISKYSKLLTLDPTTEVAGVYYNGLLNGDSSVTYRVAPSSGVFGSSTPATSGNGSEPTPLCGLGSIYYVQFTVTLKDTTIATFPDSGAANTTDVTTYYRLSATPPPNLRLNGGKWFYEEAQRPLDTCKI